MNRLDTDRITGHDNNLGLLRLLFAGLVVVAHSAVLVDGNCARELFTRMFGQITSGEVAVDGFFLVSGYLVTQSFIQTASVPTYLVKRCFRILPGYIASFSICVLVVAPFVGGTLSPETLVVQTVRMIYLLCPTVPDVFDGLPYSNLNGSLWTIAYEFRCYIATAIIGSVGCYHSRVRWILVLLVAALLIANATGALGSAKIAHPEIWGEPAKNARLFGLYGVGVLFYLYRDRIPLTARGAGCAAALLLPMLFSRGLAEAGLAVFGGYIVFWAAFAVRRPKIVRLDRETDISYGLYLYAWPIQNILIYHDRTIDPWVLCAISLPLAALAGYASWRLVERPCLLFARRELAAARPIQTSPVAG